MSFINPFPDFAYSELLQTLLPDFVLAFALFTALTYAVLGKRVGQQRPAVAMSGTIGLALAIGLVWWEQQHDWSIRDLGPLAMGFAVIMLAMILYQAIKQVGGTWAGGGIALGASLLVAWVLGAQWPMASQIVQTVIAVLVIGGVLAFLSHRHGAGRSAAMPQAQPRNHDLRRAIKESKVERNASKRLGREIKQTERRADQLFEHPEDAGDIMLQLNRMLPEEGWLTERIAGLRTKIQYMEQGQFGQIEEIQAVLTRLPPERRKQAIEELSLAYKELSMDRDLEKLDQRVAVAERQIMNLTREAQARLAQGDYRRVHGILGEARKLQENNTKLIRHIRQTEEQIARLANRITHDQAREKRQP